VLKEVLAVPEGDRSGIVSRRQLAVGGATARALKVR
jgi:hypothetical protein